MSDLGSTVHLQIDRWRIRQYTRQTGMGAVYLPAVILIEHKCSVAGLKWEEQWRGMIYTTGNRGTECPLCKERPAEGLQACFWFLMEGS